VPPAPNFERCQHATALGLRQTEQRHGGNEREALTGRQQVVEMVLHQTLDHVQIGKMASQIDTASAIGLNDGQRLGGRRLGERTRDRARSGSNFDDPTLPALQKFRDFARHPARKSRR
jgi:hypothetical protein